MIEQTKQIVVPQVKKFLPQNRNGTEERKGQPLRPANLVFAVRWIRGTQRTSTTLSSPLKLSNDDGALLCYIRRGR